MSSVLHHDEAVERALFARRARAAVFRPGAPPLEAVLRAARDESRESSRGRGRAWTGVVLAAACLLAMTRTRSRDVSPAAITTDARPTDALAAAAAEPRGGTCEEDDVGTWKLDRRYASVAAFPPVPAGEDRACVVPPATFEASRMLSCDRDEANRSEAP